MKSKIYHCQVMHTRTQPLTHHFVYPLYMYAIDLSELQQIDQTIPVFGYNRFRPVSLHDRDYLHETEGSIQDRLYSLLEHQNLGNAVERIVLVTSARYFNYIFNPVSFYYCYGNDGSLRCTVAEVNNTFKEKHLYILTHPNEQNSYMRYTVDKEFHVSPFNDMQGEYDFRFHELTESLDIRLDILRDNKKVFQSRLWGKALPLTQANMIRTIVRFPLAPWLTMPRILWQAAKLYYGKKMIVYTKPHPTHTMTIRTAPATGIEKWYISFVLKYLSTLRYGFLQITMPDHTTQCFGDSHSASKADMRIHDYAFFRRVVHSGDIGFGESYTAGDWETSDLAALLKFFILNKEAMKDYVIPYAWLGRKINHLRHAMRKNSLSGSQKNIEEHYDLSNEFFALFLDPSMTYSSAFFANEHDSLEQAQFHKLNKIIRKADIQSTDHVLEIGSGWGSLSMHAVKETGCRVTTITLSKEQQKYVQDNVAQAGLEDRIEVLLCDYRNVQGQFDKIISIEMIEAVGHEYLGTYFAALDRLLKPAGIAVIQAITIIDQNYDLYRKEGDWIQKHIFPGAVVPSLKAMNEALEKQSAFFIDQIENIGLHYVRTLQAWKHNFQAQSQRILDMGFDQQFLRTWEYYFSYCEAGFAAQVLNDLQIVLKRPCNTD
jgi:cyclopropane-fatty-acyl-phospholipid synthase